MRPPNVVVGAVDLVVTVVDGGEAGARLAEHVAPKLSQVVDNPRLASARGTIDDMPKSEHLTCHGDPEGIVLAAPGAKYFATAEFAGRGVSGASGREPGA